MSAIKAEHFHPMRGHVEDGNTVLFSEGRELTIKCVTGGWALMDKSGRQVGGTADGAAALTHLVVQLEDGHATR